MENNIPKIIHYCWFGGNQLSDLAKKCISSWEKYFPEYEIKEWNETNFDINCCQYVKDAYNEKKWAHVSDYVRFYALYNYGGIYFDTDVEVIKDFNDLLKKGSFMGCEKDMGGVNAGLACAFYPKHYFVKTLLDDYETSSFYDNNGNADLYNTVVVRVTNLLKKYNYIENNEIQYIKDITIYTKEFFNPMIYETGELVITNHTYSIHWFDASWLPKGDRKIHLKEQQIRQKYKGPISNVYCFIYRKGYRLLEKLHIIKI